MENTVLVTGGAGFIGSHVSERLLELNYKVICIDNFNDYYDPKIKESNIRECLKNKNFELHKLDITNLNSLENLFNKNNIDYIIHIAARAGVRASIENPFLYEKVNVGGTLNLLEIAKKFKIKKLIFTSSSSVYGVNKKVPFSEEDPVNNPISPYAATKASAEILCKAYNNLYKIPIVCLRLFTVYGPRGRPDMAPYKFMKLIDEEKQIPVYGDGTSKRDYTYVSDVVDGITSALEKNINFETINLGNSNPIELKKFIFIIEKQVGKKAILQKKDEQKGDVPLTYADISKAERLLGYKPKIKLEEGIKKMVQWYRNQPKDL